MALHTDTNPGLPLPARGHYPLRPRPALRKVTDLSWSSWETCCADVCMSHVGTWSIFIEQTPTYSWIYFSKFSKADFSRVPNPHFLPSHPNSVVTSIVLSQKPVSKQGLASRVLLFLLCNKTLAGLQCSLGSQTRAEIGDQSAFQVKMRQREARPHWSFVVSSLFSNVSEALKSQTLHHTCSFGDLTDPILAEQGGKPAFGRMAKPDSCKYEAVGNLLDRREKHG